ncbi:MAG: Kelch repeat-containing protein [Planctomycetota bacterium JB042]
MNRPLTLSLSLALTLSTIAAPRTHAEDLALSMKGGGVGLGLDISVDGAFGEAYLLVMSTKYEATALPAPHASPIDVGLDLLGFSVAVPGFVGLTPANLTYAIPEDPTLDGVVLNFQALHIEDLVFDGKSNPYRLTFSDPEVWHPTLEASPFQRAFPTATPLADGTVLLAGGSPTILPYDSASAMFSSQPGAKTAERYHPATESFEAIANMVQGRFRHRATLLDDGRVLITGGSNGLQALASCEIYDPQTGTFSATGAMAQGRIGHTATLLADGRVLVAGGATAGPNQLAIAQNALNTTELYDPQTGTFSSGASMVFPRAFHTADRVSNGDVIFAGGFSNSGGSVFTTSSIMRFVPDAGVGKFWNLASLITPRAGHGSAVLPNDRVMLIGGFSFDQADLVATPDEPSIAQCEIVYATTSQVIPSATLSAQAAFPNVIVLDNDDLLVAGGQYGSGSLDQPMHVGSLYRAHVGNGGWFHTGNMNGGRIGGAGAPLPDGTGAIFHGFTFGAAFENDGEIYQPEPK